MRTSDTTPTLHRRNSSSMYPNELTAPQVQTAPTSDPFGMFDDPSTKLFTNMLGSRINALQAPVNDPTTNAVMGLISSRIPGLLNAQPMNVGYGGNSLLGDLVASGRKRIDELNQEPFSAGEEAAMKTRAAEDVEQLRTASRQRALEDTSRLGQAKTSGTLQARYQGVDAAADTARAKGTNDLMLAIAQERQRRKDQAVQVAQSLAAAGQAEAGMGLQGQGLRLQAQGMADAKQQQAVQLASMLAQMSAAQRGEADARSDKALGYAGTLSDLPMQRMMAALSVLNGTGANNPASIASQFGSLSGLTSANQNQNNQNQAAMLAGLGQILGYMGKRS